MKYIKKIILENFQSHKYSVIELDQRMNVIVGPSDSGKSAIIRGLKWVLFNEPSGNYFIREGETECSVSVEFNDGTILKRIRSKSKNAYVLINNKGDEMKFEGFGTVIPMEIIESIGIKKIHLDSTESSYINLGEQLEGPFLISEKTSTRASAIGRLVGVNIVDEALRDVLKDIRALNISKKSLEDNNSELKSEIESYSYLNIVKDNFEKAKELEVRIKNKTELLSKLKANRLIIIDIENENLQLNNILQQLDSIQDLDRAIITIDSKVIKHKYINNHARALKKVKDDIDFNSKIIMELQGMEEADNKVIELERKNLTYGRLRSISNSMKTNKVDIKIINDTLKKLEGLEKAEKDLAKAVTSVENYNKIKEALSEYISINKSLLAGKEYIDKFSNISETDHIYKDLEYKLNQLSKYKNLYGVFIKYSEEIKKEELNLKNINNSICENLNKYKLLLKKVEICPFCFNEIDEKKIEHIINDHIGG